MYGVCTSSVQLLLDLRSLYEWKCILGTSDRHSTVFGSILLRLSMYTLYALKKCIVSSAYGSCKLLIVDEYISKAQLKRKKSHNNNNNNIERSLLGFSKDFELVRIFPAHYLFPTNHINKHRILFNRIHNALSPIMLYRCTVNLRDTNA